jgi:hypothetical protein
MRGSRRNAITLIAVAMCVALAGCAKPQPREGGSPVSKAEKARKDAEALALSAVTYGAKAQAQAVPEARRKRDAKEVFVGTTIAPDAAGKAPPGPPDVATGPNASGKGPSGAPEVVVKEPPAPKSPLRPGAPTVIRERIVSAVPYATEAEAEEDALTQARDIVEQKLAALDPPVRHKPSIGEVRTEFVRKDSRTMRQPDEEEKARYARYELPNTNLVYVEFDVEVTADQVRELRAQERVSAGLRVLGVLVVIALASFLFLRADEWTKGYLTHWLALGAAILAGGATAALIFV